MAVGQNQGVTVAERNRAIRQQALREQLSGYQLVTQVVDIANKLESLNNELSSTECSRLKSAAEIKLRLINKYLPDLKQIEADFTSSDGTMSPVKIEILSLVNKPSDAIEHDNIEVLDYDNASS